MYSLFFSFYKYLYTPNSHSFPTRRSSDLSRALAHSKHHKVLSGYERRQGACPCRQRRQHVPRQVREPPLLQRRTPWLHVDRKSTRLNSSHTVISYAVFCLKKKKYN